MFRHRAPSVLAAPALALMLAACGDSERAPAIGEAWIGAAKVELRRELGTRMEPAGSVSFGERVEIVGKRRRFLRIRTAKGVEGWLDSRQLLNREDVEEWRRLQGRAGEMPKQGEATVLDALNVHPTPNRTSPNQYQIQPGEKVSMHGVFRAPRIPYEPKIELRSLAPPKKPAARKKKAKDDVAPPAPGPPPPVVPNWLELSGNPHLRSAAPAEPSPAPPPAAAPMDDWALVRDAQGRAGWALARMLVPAVPDDIAGYAERARIVSYFVLPQLASGADSPPAYFWATLKRSGESYQFDSVRLFLYRVKKQRWESGFIMRDLRGYLPITFSNAEEPQVTLLLESPEGKLERHVYSLAGGRGKLVLVTGAERQKPLWKGGEPGPDPESTPDTVERATSWWRALLARLRGG